MPDSNQELLAESKSIIERLLNVNSELMPGIQHLSNVNYLELNEASVDAKQCLKKLNKALEK